MTAQPKPCSPAAERNREPILDVLRGHYAEVRSVLEIGSGTGQHAVHFAAALPHLRWQTSDVAEHLPGIRLWLAEAALPNLPGPLAFDVAGAWPDGRYDAVYTANTLHIMGWTQVERLFGGLPDVLAPGGLLTVYGPFRQAGRFSGPGDADFDASLRAADPRRGLRDLEAVDALAAAAGLERIDDRAMPANNRCLTWRSMT